MTIKTKTTQVQIGTISIKGLVSENGDFGVPTSQLAILQLIPPNRSEKQLKALFGEDLLVEKWSSPLNGKPVNVVLLSDLERLIFSSALKENPKAIEFWNQLHPDKKIKSITEKTPPNPLESKVESRIFSLYLDWNPKRQVATEFGVADIVHDHGVVKVKEFKGLSSAHKAIGQAMSYGSLLNKQPEVVLFNVQSSEVEKMLRLFTAIGILVLLYTIGGTLELLSGERLLPEHTNVTEIQFQLSRH